nr:MAG TPA: hypothetical protein [Caudoviricetes sp.]
MQLLAACKQSNKTSPTNAKNFFLTSKAETEHVAQNREKSPMFAYCKNAVIIFAKK